MKNKTEGYWQQTSERKISQEKEPKPHTHSRATTEKLKDTEQTHSPPPPSAFKRQ